VAGPAELITLDHPLVLISPAVLPYSFFMDRYAEAYVDVVRAFVQDIKDGGGTNPFLASGLDGKAAFLTGVAAKKSLDEKRPVRISEVA
jgi:myo-inositol 2-dehydrogenase/D-chiro-inositol 1-dehydrogenase